MSIESVAHPPAIYLRVDTPLRLRLDSVSEIGGCSSLCGSCLTSVHPIDGPLVGRKRIFGIENQDLPIVEREFGRFSDCFFSTPPIFGRRLDSAAQNGATFGATTEGTAKRQEGSPEVRGHILNPNPRTHPPPSHA